MLVLFFTIGDQTVTDALTGSRNNPQTQVIGEVNDAPIYYVEFEQKVRERVEQQRAQQQDPDQQIDDAQIRAQVWNEMVERILLKQEAEKAGIFITDAMIRDELIENPPQYLTQSFLDSAGNFQRDLYLTLVTNPAEIVNYMGVDPSQLTQQQIDQQVSQFRNDLLLIEDFLRDQKLTQAIQTAANSASAIISPAYAKQKYLQDNSKASFTYVGIKISDLKNPEVEVTDEEIKNYYDKNKEYFKQEDQRKIKYVSFKIIPSADDSARATRRINTILEALNSAQTQQEKDSIYDVKLSEYSGITHDYTYIKDVPPDAIQVVGMAEENEIIGPLRTREGTTFFRVEDRRSGENVNVKASHILINFGNDKDSAKAEAERIMKEAKSGKDFGSLAMQYSDDPGSKMNGGDLGFFGKGRMVKPFEEAAFAAEKGEITGPVESQFGWHIIYVEDKNSDEIKYSEITIAPRVSNITKNMIYRDATSLATQVKEGTPMDTVVSRLNRNDNRRLRVVETRAFGKGLPVLGSQYLSDKAFELELGDVIQPDEYDNYGVLVAQVSEIQKKGIKKLENVREEIQKRLEKEKKLDMLEKMAQDIYSQAKNLDSLSKLSGKISYEVKSLDNVKYQPFIAGLGKEPFIAYEIFNQPIGAVSAPLRGDAGYYIIQVHNRNIPDEAGVTDEQLIQKASELKSTAMQGAFMQWFTKVRENANIVDKRSQYYREY